MLNQVALTEQHILMMQKLSMGNGASGPINSEAHQKIIYESLRRQSQTDPDFAQKLETLASERVSLRVADSSDRAGPGNPRIGMGAGVYHIKIDPQDLNSPAPKLLDIAIRGVAKSNAYNIEAVRSNAAVQGASLSDGDKNEIAKNESTIRKMEGAIPDAGKVPPRENRLNSVQQQNTSRSSFDAPEKMPELQSANNKDMLEGRSGTAAILEPERLMPGMHISANALAGRHPHDSFKEGGLATPSGSTLDGGIKPFLNSGASPLMEIFKKLFDMFEKRLAGASTVTYQGNRSLVQGALEQVSDQGERPKIISAIPEDDYQVAGIQQPSAQQQMKL